MTKQELELKKKDELIDIILEQTHLSSAIQAKDKEISDLKEKHKEEKIKEIESLKLAREKEEKNLVTQIEQRERVINSLAKTTQEILDRYHSLLKIMQGTVDTHIEMHGFSTQLFEAHFPKKNN